MIQRTAWLRREWRGAAVVLLAAALATAPMLWHGASCSGDFYFHLTSWLDAQRALVLGVPFPHWMNSANLGAGEPRFMFYPPLTWIEGAALGLVLPWATAPVAFIFLQLAATGIAVWRLAREKLAEGSSTLAGCTAIFFGYALFNVYKRGAYAELAGGFWIPLLLLYLLRRRKPEAGTWRSAFDGSTAPLAIVLAGAWLTNGPVGVMASYLMAAIAVASSLVEKKWAPLVRVIVAGVTGFGLAAVYLLPAAWEQRWASLQYAVTEYRYLIENSWMFARHADRTLYSHDLLLREISWVGAGMLAFTLVGAVIAWARGTLPDRGWWTPLALIPVAVLFMQLPISLPVWRSLPELRFLQFPWRWLLILEAPMAIFFATAFWPARRASRLVVIAVCTVTFAAISFTTARYWALDCGRNQARVVSDFYAGAGTSGMFEYAPPAARFGTVDRRLPGTCLAVDLPGLASSATPAWYEDTSQCTGHFSADLYAPEHKHITGVADRAGYLIVRLRSYPAWSVILNKAPVQAVPENAYGFMAVPVLAGPVDLTIDWKTTPDVIAARWISCAFLLALVALAFVEKRLARRPL